MEEWEMGGLAVTDPDCLHFKSVCVRGGAGGGGAVGKRSHAMVSISSEKSALQFKQVAPLSCLHPR